jgi:hypothetical protein
MILYQIVCENDHSFEAWFRDSAGYDQQVALGEVSCPLCGTPHVRKALMAPRLARRKGRDEAALRAVPAGAPDGAPEAAKTVAGPRTEISHKIREALHDLRRQVEAQCDYVGDRFADEARKIHAGESGGRPIYGETTREEAETLKEEGVDFVSVPWLKADG